MNDSHPNTFPKLHNAMWPGLVGKGSPGAEPTIDLDTMLDLTAAAEVDGIKFDGVDLFLYDPHINIDISDDDLKALAEKIAGKGFNDRLGRRAGLVRRDRRWGTTSSARTTWTPSARPAGSPSRLRELGVRPYGVVRIDSACSPADWAKDPEGNQKKIAETFKQAAAIARDHGERLAAEGEICWGGMHSWRTMVDLLERVGEPDDASASRPTWPTRSSTPWARTPPRTASCPRDYDWSDRRTLDDALKTLTAALRPWTIDFHVAQNDATVFGSGTHDHTGRHCLATDPNGKLDIPHHAGFWLRDEKGQLTKAIRHICWDGCMFPNAVMMKPETWNNILAAMIAVRDAHGWTE